MVTDSLFATNKSLLLINPKIKYLGVADYDEILIAMQEFTNTRDENTADEFWVLEHNPIFTLGLAGKEEHILQLNNKIPIKRCDRGGQVTYHGLGQLVVYLLIDLRRQGNSIRDLVTRIENAIIKFLDDFGIKAYGDRDKPGVYVNGRKIASLGLKVRKGCTYHGLSFNINMDLAPFNYINVCGYQGLQVTQLVDLLGNNKEQIVKTFNLDASITLMSQEFVPYLVESIYPFCRKTSPFMGRK